MILQIRQNIRRGRVVEPLIEENRVNQAPQSGANVNIREHIKPAFSYSVASLDDLKKIISVLEKIILMICNFS